MFISCRLQQASVVSCAVLLLIMGAVLSGLQFWYTKGTPTVQGVYLLLQTAACSGLLAFLIIRGRSARDGHLLWLAYALLALCAALCIVSLPIPLQGWAGTAMPQTVTKATNKAEPAVLPKSSASTDLNVLITSTRAPKGQLF